jgi:glycerol uptake facilitator-like aquaporin
MSKPASLPRRLAAEGMGTAFLLMAVIGSGIMGERLAAGNNAIALLANSTATGCVLAVLILIFAPVSGAHFNPAVTLCMALHRKISIRDALAYAGMQTAAALLGVVAAHLMFEEPLLSASQKLRTGGAQWWSEGVAAFGLLTVIWACARQNLNGAPLAVAAYIAGAYWFTASTSFANPAVTIARGFSDTFAGIRPEDVGPFVAAQIAGAAAATLFCNWLFKSR